MKGAFYGCSALRTVAIPDTVESIGDYAFGGCSALTTLAIGDGVTTIGYQAFCGLANLVNLTFGASVEDIGESAFNGCANLKPFTLPATLQTLGPWCFANCSKALTTVAIPTNKDGVTVTVGEGCFAYDTSLRSVSLGDTYEVVRGTTHGHGPGTGYFDGHGTFYGCTALTAIDWGSSVKTVMKGAFYGCSALVVVDLPPTVEFIGDYAFAADTSLRRVTIPGNLTYLGAYAFSGCTALHYVEFLGDTAPTSTGSNPFNNTKAQMIVYASQASTGWTGVASEAGFPSSGTWQGRTIMTRPPNTHAGNPYDFYPYVRTDTISRVGYPWSMILTTTPYVSGRTVPATPAVIYDDETVYLSYCFDEYWRGEAFNVTNVFTLTGMETGSFSLGCADSAHAAWTHWWTTNDVPELLQGLPVGDYVLSVTLNGDRRLAETDYFSNTTSITFRIEAAPLWTVTFNPNGGTVTEASRRVKRNTAVGELPVPERVGYYFVGWFTRTSGGTQATEATPVTAESMTWYARWTAKPRYSITFDANGGSTSEMRTVYGGDALGELPRPTKAGSYLLGWFTAVTDGTQITADTLATGTATYYARWQEGDGRFRVTFGKNGGTGGDAYVTATYGSAMPSPRTAPTKAGYTFDGYWNTTKVGGKQYYDANMRSVCSWDRAATATLWAKWTPACYRVTLGKNGGTGGDAYVTATYGSAMPTPRTAPTKSGYVFEGYWTTTATNGVQYYDGDMKSVRSWDKVNDATLWAKWRKAETVRVTFGKNGGTGGDAYVTATEGKPMPTPRTAPTRAGWTFGGYWDTLATDANGTPLGKQYYDSSMKSVRAWDRPTAVTLWAKWTVNVRLGKNGGTGGDDYVTVTFNQSFPKRTMPTRAGYVFGGYWISSGSRTGQCYNSDGTGTASMKWTTGGTPTVWALWTSAESASMENRRRTEPANVEIPLVAAPYEYYEEDALFSAGTYTGVFADDAGMFSLMLDEGLETAYLMTWMEDGGVSYECEVMIEDDAIVLTMADGETCRIAWDDGVLVATYEK